MTAFLLFLIACRDSKFASICGVSTGTKWAVRDNYCGEIRGDIAAACRGGFDISCSGVVWWYAGFKGKTGKSGCDNRSGEF